MRRRTADRLERVRRIARERAEHALAEASGRRRAEIARAERGLLAAARTFVASGDPSRGVVEAAALYREGEYAEAMRMDAALAARRAAALAEEVEKRRREFLERRKAEKAAEKLCERLRSREREAFARKEQLRLDEFGAGRGLGGATQEEEPA